MQTRRLVAGWLALLVAATVARPAAGQEETPPLDVGHQERAEVRLVLVDVVAVDRQGRTVPDLQLEDFVLKYGGRWREIESLDVHCPAGPAEDRRGRWFNAAVPPTTAVPAPAAPDARIVLAFDYFHMGLAFEVLDFARDAIGRDLADGQEVMIVIIGETLSLVTPFTADRNVLLASLDRMQYDPTLYAGNYGRLTETRVFQRISSLLDLMEVIPGRKAVVMFSGPFVPDGFTHDGAFRRISALAGRSRTSLYPVDSHGMVGMRTIAPPTLARLAVETGGRLTANTNDLTLGVSRAQRDFGCRYTLGFRDHDPRLDRSRRLFVGVERGGVRVHYPDFLVLRSDERRRKSLTRTASMVPELFDGSRLAVEAWAGSPESKRKRAVRLEVRLPPFEDDPYADPGTWELRGVVRTVTGAIVHRFRHRISPDPEEAADEETTRLEDGTIVESASLKAGHYRAVVVLARPDTVEPTATSVAFVVPPIQK